MLQFSFDESAPFWTAFVSEHWEQSPVVIDVTAAHPALDLATLFSAVTTMTERGRSDRFWLARSAEPASRADFVMLDLDLMGPQPADEGFEGFFTRMASHSYGINIHRLGEAQGEYRELVNTIASALKGAPGPTPTFWQSDTFFGNYRATPFGIHRDPASVFSFALSGRRTYYTWPMEAFEPGDPDLHKIDPAVLKRHLPRAERFDVTAGQVFYWPSNRWHLVAADGEPFVVAQVSAYFDPKEVGQA